MVFFYDKWRVNLWLYRPYRTTENADFPAANFRIFIIFVSRHILSNAAKILVLIMDCPSAKLTECKMTTNFYSWIFDIFSARYFENASGGFGSCNPNFSLLSFSSSRFTHRLKRFVVACSELHIAVSYFFFKIPSREWNSLAIKYRDP